MLSFIIKVYFILYYIEKAEKVVYYIYILDLYISILLKKYILIEIRSNDCNFCMYIGTCLEGPFICKDP